MSDPLDDLFPVYCTVCHKAITRDESDRNRGPCDDCQASAASVPPPLPVLAVPAIARPQPVPWWRRPLFAKPKVAIRCPKCGSDNVFWLGVRNPNSESLLNAAGCSLLLSVCTCFLFPIALVLLGASLTSVRKRNVCRGCGFEWTI